MKAIAPKDRVIVKIDVKQKEKYALTKDITLKIERGYNFNQREDRASSGYVIDGENLPTGAYVLTNYLAVEPTYEVPYQHEFLTEKEIEEGYKIFSIPKDMVFAYFENEWKPCEDYLLTQRIFKPYSGSLTGIEPEVVKNRLYVTKGKEEGKVVLSELNSDYEIIWHSKENREERLIRTMTRQVLGVDNGMLKDLKNGKYLIGLSPSTAKILVHNKIKINATQTRKQPKNRQRKYSGVS